ncbi:hypothetical protein MUG94_06425 [Arthrobacter gengyunqii]|uniref:Uncharacterized protein n=1 Tax=Arthrobacter gengyunqii TaxID=2886940 RepID=A0A9X1M3A7_9MICC|nr:hypothetical protein [Arthrobacter gengyunqii]MCC3270579.1 hypothetical protein [Arthrobacter gengyunqii]UOY97376.1 hypothetical protein MUG94_06425 [Arthrobacter gengyunqii]
MTALAAAALLLTSAGCTSDSETSDAGSGTPSASASASAGASSPSASGSASSSPSSTGPSASAGATESSGSTATPSATSTSGAIAEGFPTDLIPLLPGSTALTTSFEETSTLFTASLSGKTDSSAEEILAFYAKTFSAQGFTPADPEVQDPATVQQFVRSGGDDTANVTVVSRDGSFFYTASINTLPESAK